MEETTGESTDKIIVEEIQKVEPTRDNILTQPESKGEDQVPLVEEDKVLLVEKDQVPLVEEDKVPVEKDQVPLVEKDQVPLVEKGHVPLVEEDQVPLVEKDQVPLVEEGNVPFVEEDQVPLVEKGHVPLVEKDQVPLVEDLEETKNKRLARACRKEIQNTELTYLLSLKSILEVFYKNMTEDAKIGKIGISEKEIDSIFGNIPEIIKFHEGVYPNLEVNVESTEGEFETALYNIFTSPESDFELIYVTYASTYQIGVQILEKYKNDGALQNFFKEKLEDPKTNGLTLQSLLIGPIKRPLRLGGTLASLKQLVPEPTKTEKVHPVHQLVTGVAKKVNEVFSKQSQQQRNPPETKLTDDICCVQ